MNKIDPGIHSILQLRTIPDSRGKLCVIEQDNGFPFSIKRVYYLFDVPSGSMRGGHAHLALQQVLIAISGSMVVEVITHRGTQSYRLDRPDQGLFIGPYVWREIHSFSSNAVCLVLASMAYSEADYIRDRGEFEATIGSFP